MLPVAEALQCFLSMMADLQLFLKMEMDGDVAFTLSIPIISKSFQLNWTDFLASSIFFIYVVRLSCNTRTFDSHDFFSHYVDDFINFIV